MLPDNFCLNTASYFTKKTDNAVRCPRLPYCMIQFALLSVSFGESTKITLICVLQMRLEEREYWSNRYSENILMHSLSARPEKTERSVIAITVCLTAGKLSSSQPFKVCSLTRAGNILRQWISRLAQSNVPPSSQISHVHTNSIASSVTLYEARSCNIACNCATAIQGTLHCIGLTPFPLHEFRCDGK